MLFVVCHEGHIAKRPLVVSFFLLHTANLFVVCFLLPSVFCVAHRVSEKIFTAKSRTHDKKLFSLVNVCVSALYGLLGASLVPLFGYGT